MLDPLKKKLIAQAKAELGEVMDDLIRTKGRSFTAADLHDALEQRCLNDAQPAKEVDRMPTALNNGRRAPARVRISPTVAADYQTRNVFPDLRPPDGKPVDRYFMDRAVTRAVAQAVFDDAVEQAARSGSLERRSLTLAYNALARRTSLNFGDGWNPYDPSTACSEPCDFREQAPVVDALLRAVSQTPNGKPQRSPKKGD